MTHQEIQDKEIIEQYVRDKLTSAERHAFQEHLFECDECFEQADVTARFIAGVREASRLGVLNTPQPERARLLPGFFNQGWAFRWAMPAMAASLLVGVLIIGLWALSLRRQNQQLAQQTAEQSRAAEDLQRSEAKIRELEASGTASQEQLEVLRKENDRLKERLKTVEREKETQVAQLRQPDANVPVINIYPLGDTQRSGGTGEVNQLRLPQAARRFLLILSDFQPGLSNYWLEIMDPSGRIVTRRTGLKPDQNGELRVLLKRTMFGQGKYRVKLFGQGKPIAEYVVQVE